MSEWRDFLESVELTDRQKQIYDMVCDLETISTRRIVAGGIGTSFDSLKHLLIEEFTGVKIV